MLQRLSLLCAPPLLQAWILGWVIAALALTPSKGRAQVTISNAAVTISLTGLRDRLYDCSAATALLRAPVQAAVLHLMDEALSKNPGLLDASNSVAVMESVIRQVTNDFAGGAQLTMQDFTGLALPYLQKELAARLPSGTVDQVQAGLQMVVIAEQQGLFSSVYSNLTTALPAGRVFSEVENTATSLLSLERQAASRAAILALPERIRTAADGAYREAAATLVQQAAGITPQDGIDAIIQAVPALRNSSFVQNLADAAQRAGEAATDVITVVGAANEALGELHQSIALGSDLLGQIADSQKDVFGALLDPGVLSDSLDTARQIEADISSGIDTALATVALTSTLINLAGNSRLAQEVASVGEAALKVAGIVEQSASAIDEAEGVFSAATAVATGNWVGAALDVFSMLGTSSGPSPEQVILDQIGAVRQDIANLSAQINASFQEINGRFDRVDAALSKITGTVDQELDLINSDFAFVASNLGQIRDVLLDLQGQVGKLDSQVYTWFTAADQESLFLLLHNSLGYERAVGAPMVYRNGGAEGDFVSFEGQYWLWAVKNAVDSLYQPAQQGYGVQDLYAQLTTQAAPEESLTYINNFIGANLGVPQPFAGPLANPRIWSVSANGLSQMCVENPSYFRSYGIESDLQDIIQAGNNLNAFLNRLTSLGANGANTNLWITICGQYRAAAAAFTNAVNASLANFNLTNQYTPANGYPANFDPLTASFLSRVAGSSNIIVNGRYSTSSVQRITAMACSPTPDGMPVYFADLNTLRMLGADGVMTTLAGSTNAGFADGSPGQLNSPRGLAVAADGRIYIADSGNHAIRVFGTNGLRTLAGFTPSSTNAQPQSGGVNGSGADARFNYPQGLIISSGGSLLVADTGNHAIRQVTPSGVVTTFAGILGTMGDRDGYASGTNSPAAQFWAPQGLAMGTNGLVYVTEPISRKVRVIGADGAVKTAPSKRGILPFLLPDTLARPYTTNLDSAVAGLYTSLSEHFYQQPSLALRSDGKVIAWGDNLGADTNVPSDIADIVAVDGGNGFALALRADGTVRAWGSSPNGEPDVPSGLSNVIALASGGSHALALRSDGTVAAWGYNGQGQINVPAGLTNAIAIAGGQDYSLALRADGTVAAWGENSQGQTSVPAGLSNVVAIRAEPWDSGYNSSAALRADGTVAVWGDNVFHENNVPPGLSNVVDLQIGYNHISALRSDGSVVSWGSNFDGQTNVPAGLSNVVAIAVGDSDTLALRADGTVVSWGLNTFVLEGFTLGGQGNVPAGLDNAVAVAAGREFSLALTADGSVVPWGDIGLPAYRTNVPRPSAAAQLLDTLASNAAVEGFSSGTVIPDGRVLVADQFGLRLFDNSTRIQKRAALWLSNDLLSAGGTLGGAGKALTAWRLLLQTLATYGLNDALANDDVLHGLFFGGEPDPVSAYLNEVISSSDWRPTHANLGQDLFQRIDLTQGLLVGAVQKAASQRNPANLPLVTDTLNRLNLLLASHSQAIPPAVLTATAGGTNQTLQVSLTGYPYVRYRLSASADLQHWTTNSALIEESGAATYNISGKASFFRAEPAD